MLKVGVLGGSAPHFSFQPLHLNISPLHIKVRPLHLLHGECELKALCQGVSYHIQWWNEHHLTGLQYRDTKVCAVEQTVRRVETLPVSTAECERGFSWMSLICDEFAKRHRSEALVVSVGPSLHIVKGNPEPYVRWWLASGRRTAAATDCSAAKEIQRRVQTANPTRQFVWKL